MNSSNRQEEASLNVTSDDGPDLLEVIGLVLEEQFGDEIDVSAVIEQNIEQIPKEIRDLILSGEDISENNPKVQAAVQASADEIALRYAARRPVRPIRNDEDKIGRNDPCPCGCGKKYKKHLGVAK